MVFKADGRSNPDTREGEFRLLVGDRELGFLTVSQGNSYEFKDGFNWQIMWPDIRKMVNDVKWSFLDVSRRILGDERELDLSDRDTLTGLAFHLYTSDRWDSFNFRNYHNQPPIEPSNNKLTFYHGVSPKVVQAYRNILHNVKPDDIEEFEFYFMDTECKSFRYPVEGKILQLELRGSRLYNQEWHASVKGSRDFVPTASLLEFLVDNHVERDALVGNINYDEAAETIQDKIRKTLSPGKTTHLVLWDRNDDDGHIYLADDLARPYSSAPSLEDAREVLKYRASYGQKCVLGEIVLSQADKKAGVNDHSPGRYLLVHEITRWESGAWDGVNYDDVIVTPYYTFNALKDALTNVQVPSGWDSTVRVYGIKVIEESWQQSLF